MNFKNIFSNFKIKLFSCILAGTIVFQGIFVPMFVHASVIKDMTEKLTYSEVYKRYSKVTSEMFNEKKIVDGNYEQLARDIAKVRWERLEYERKILNELLIIKRTSSSSAQKLKADETLTQLETGPVKKLLELGYKFGLRGYELIEYFVSKVKI